MKQLGGSLLGNGQRAEKPKAISILDVRENWIEIFFH
jgi:hypothetical protein